MLAMTTRHCCTRKIQFRGVHLQGADCLQALPARAPFCTARSLQAVQRHGRLAQKQQAGPDLRDHRGRGVRADAPFGTELRLLPEIARLTALFSTRNG
jgi:hypothetical protein